MGTYDWPGSNKALNQLVASLPLVSPGMRWARLRRLLARDDRTLTTRAVIVR